MGHRHQLPCAQEDLRLPRSWQQLDREGRSRRAPALLDDPRFKPAAYLARGGWITMDLTAAAVDWSEIDELIRTSYCLIAPKKLAALATRSACTEFA